MRLANRDEMSGETRGLGGYLAEERSRLFDGASPKKREQMLAAERTREVYRAWNAVCAHTREGSHATGLHYRPETNELIVYMDSAAWTQEMTMLREIIRARMAATGVDVAGLVFMTSKEGYASRASSAAAAGTAAGTNGSPDSPAKGPAGSSSARRAAKTPPPHKDLTPAESTVIDREVSGIKDQRLQEALKSAMKASFEWRKGLDAQNKA